MGIKIGIARGSSSRAIIVKTIDLIITHLQVGVKGFCKIYEKYCKKSPKNSKL
jgi:hypothetical protein